MAMPASLIGGSAPSTRSHSSGTNTQLSAASTKIASTRTSPEPILPRFRRSERMSSLPPGISVISGLNSTLVSRSQAMIMNTMAIGAPTIIQRPKPRVIPKSWLIWAASRALGGVPMMVASEPIEAA